MHVARAGQYAIRALLELAATGGGTVGGIAERTGLPAPFLQQLVGPLKRAGLVEARRGPHGGLALARPVEEVTLLSVLEAVGVQDEVQETQWLSMLPEPHRTRLEGIERLLPDELGLLTLADLVPHLEDPALPAPPVPFDLLPPRRLLDYIGHQAVAVAHAHRCAVYFGGESYGFVTTAVEMRDEVPVTLPESDISLTAHWVPSRPVGAMAVAWMTGRPVVINDTLADPRASRELAIRFKVRSVAAIPIHAGRQGSGILVVAKQEPNAWDPADLERATELATIAGLAVIGHHHVARGGDEADEE